jgi:hypothetical protein
MSKDGASIDTLLNKARRYDATLLVLKDSNGALFGGFIGEKLKTTGPSAGGLSGKAASISKIHGRTSFMASPHMHGDKYYGGVGTIMVFSFVTGALQVGGSMTVTIDSNRSIISNAASNL